MLFDIALGFFFVSSAATAWYFVSLKIPAVVNISDRVIVRQLQLEPSKFYLVILNLKKFFREHYYKKISLHIAGKALYRMHILFMRFDNWTVTQLQNMRERNGGTLNGNGNYWKELKEGRAKSDS